MSESSDVRRMNRDVRIAIICWAGGVVLLALSPYVRWTLGAALLGVALIGIGGIRPLCRIMWLGYADRTLHEDSDTVTSEPSSSAPVS